MATWTHGQTVQTVEAKLHMMSGRTVTMGPQRRNADRSDGN